MANRFTVQPANLSEAFLRGRSQVKSLREQESQTQLAEKKLAAFDEDRAAAKKAAEDAATKEEQDNLLRMFGADAMQITESYGQGSKAALAAAQAKVKQYTDMYAETGDERYLQAADNLQAAVKSGVDNVIQMSGGIANMYMRKIGEDPEFLKPKETAPVSLQQKKVNVDGKEALVSWNPKTQEFFDTSGQRIEGSRITPVQTKGQTINVNTGEGSPSIFEKKADERAAETVLNWAEQGRTMAVNNLNEFRRIQAGLESGEINTRTIGDYIPFVSEPIRKLFNEPAAEAVNDIRAIAFQVLRETLGAQFTEKEGERLMATYFDPQLSEEANIKRMKRLGSLTAQLIEDKDRLAKYMQENRTSMGFEYVIKDPMQAVRNLANSPKGREEIDISRLPKKNEAGWSLMQDANGNVAYVSPDGSQFEEIK